jgi:hypothetical protein
VYPLLLRREADRNPQVGCSVKQPTIPHHHPLLLVPLKEPHPTTPTIHLTLPEDPKAAKGHQDTDQMNCRTCHRKEVDWPAGLPTWLRDDEPPAPIDNCSEQYHTYKWYPSLYFCKKWFLDQLYLYTHRSLSVINKTAFKFLDFLKKLKFVSFKLDGVRVSVCWAASA